MRHRTKTTDAPTSDLNLTKYGAPPSGPRTPMLDLWYKNAIIYSLDVETFLDANGDGIGDFQGITDKLDYFAGLNVDCLWLLPFYPSPNRDDGYDITDYYGVDARLGTLGDFVVFTRQARERGIRVIIDLVVNHTSIDHPWFQAARRDPTSVYRNYYVWSKTKPADAHEGMVFPGKQESVWTFDEQAQLWYFHRFYSHQPDLNVANPAVRGEIAKIMGFWLQLGVSGFRVDAIPFLLEHRGIDAPLPYESEHEYLREFRNYLSWRRGDAVLLAEANLEPREVPAYFDKGDKIQLMFNFFVNQQLFLALARGEAEPIRRAWTALPQLPEIGQWANFLRTHDELDLGRLPEEARDEVFRQFAPEENMRLYGRGIRRRLAPMLRNDRRRLECAYSLLLTLPGTPVLRYGDEIGMGDDLSLDERDTVRTPMQWNSSTNGGFSIAPRDKLIQPVIDSGEFSYERLNVDAQQRDPDSLLNWTERVLRVRREHPEFGWGTCEFIDTSDKAVLAHRVRWHNSSSVMLHNLSDRSVTVDLEVPDIEFLEDLLTRKPENPERDRYRLKLGPYGYRWLREEKRR
jgi:maltose alpha-D-glucosyltransferase / alpha-amylase